MRLIITVALFAGLLLSVSVIPGCISGPPSGPAVVPTAAATDSFMYLTEDFPPFNYLENGSPHGISIELLKEITKRMGDPVADDRIRFLPWADAYRTALEEKNTVLFSTGRIPEREPLFLWVGPIHRYQDVLFARKDRGIVIRGPEDLGRYRIGVIEDTAPVPELLAIGVNVTSLVTAADAPTLARMLRDGAIDLWSDAEPAGWYFLEQMTGDTGNYEVVYTLEGHDLYYAFNRDTPAEQVAAFREAYREVMSEKDASGITAYKRILHHYLPVNQTEGR